MEKLTILGCGTMGHSIALNAVLSGLPVKMYGLNVADVENGLNEIRKKIAVLADADLIASAKIQAVLSLIHTTTIIDEALDDCTFIIETVPEDVQVKNKLFRQLDDQCAANVILASNTSGLSLRAISEGMRSPERTLITHFWNPAHLVPLVEVLRGDDTSDEVFHRTMALLELMGKKAIEVKKEIPGLVGNRLQFALLREAQYLLETGVASSEDIDKAVTFSFGRRLSVTGPLLSADMGGLDVFASISNYLFSDLSKADQSSSYLKDLVAEGKYGSKSGEGYYRWDEQFTARINKKREQELIRLLKDDQSADSDPQT